MINRLRKALAPVIIAIVLGLAAIGGIVLFNYIMPGFGSGFMTGLAVGAGAIAILLAIIFAVARRK